MNLIDTITKMTFLIREIFISEWTLSLTQLTIYLRPVLIKQANKINSDLAGYSW